MKDFQKLSWSRDGSQLNLSFDINESDVQKRTVVGYATLDNVDYAGDVVTADASVKAFSEFRGNIRLQHDKSRPVGRLLDFKPVIYNDKNTNKTYNAIEVAVYISEGADDVWKMILDGTLSGFSISGAVRKSSKMFSPDQDKPIQVIEDYMLTELSIVDSPMNGLANVISVYKSFDGQADIDKGYAPENLFWCAVDRIGTKSKDNSIVCPKCSDTMANIGEVNNTDIKKQLEELFGHNKVDMKGGHQVEDTTVQVEKNVEGAAVVVVDEAVTESPVVRVEEETKPLPEDHAPAGEVEVASAVVVQDHTGFDIINPLQEAAPVRDLAALLEEMKVLLENSKELTAKGQSELKADFEKLSTSVADQLTAMEKKYETLVTSTDELKEKLNTTNSELEETKKRFDAAVEGTAFKKSLDDSTPHAPIVKTRSSVFEGLFTSKTMQV